MKKVMIVSTILLFVSFSMYGMQTETEGGDPSEDHVESNSCDDNDKEVFLFSPVIFGKKKIDVWPERLYCPKWKREDIRILKVWVEQHKICLKVTEKEEHKKTTTIDVASTKHANVYGGLVCYAIETFKEVGIELLSPREYLEKLNDKKKKG